MTGKFHLGWFLNFVADEWNGTWGDGGRDFTGDFYVEVARDLERAKFDYVLLEDKLMVSTAYGGTMEYDLKHGVNPKHDPVPLAVLMAQRHHPSRRRPDHVDQLLPTVSAGPAVQHDRPHRPRPVRVERRHLRRGPLSPELRSRQALRTRRKVRARSRIPRTRDQTVGVVGARRRRARSHDRDLRQLQEGPHR